MDDQQFGQWSGTDISSHKEPELGAPARVLAGTAATALTAAVVAISEGLGANALILAAALTVTAALGVRGRRIRPWTLVWALGGLALVAVPLWHGDTWLHPLTLAVALGAASLALAGGRTWWQIAIRPFAVLLLAPRGVLWVYRGFARVLPRRQGSAGAAFRAVLLTGVVTAVFAALFAAADAVFAELLNGLVPGDALALRLFLAALATVLAAGAASVAFDPPREGLWREPSLPRVPVRGRMEWLVPLAVLVALFAGFVVVQAVVLFGGVDGPLDDAGTTRAEYAREGFWQLLWVTILTLVVIATVMYVVPRDRPSDRRLAKRLVGALAVLALVVGAASLHRTDAYIDDFGLNRSRLVMAGAELWMCVVLVLVPVALVWRAMATALPRTAAAAGLVTVAVIAAASPDAMVADQRVSLYERTGRINLEYVRGLGVDAVPALDRLPEPTRSCALREIAADLADEDPPWYATSLARERAERILRDRPVLRNARCASPVMPGHGPTYGSQSGPPSGSTRTDDGPADRR
ncbi:DUF4153 domain-containing protein [Yinghuangia sp. YIM S09857]|uniref:DUF4153 domain-containing protein n=1 Tax=Yinghuangia sp. YIM S09857 TaxID=3436929 RepID=UPI003F531066